MQLWSYFLILAACTRLCSAQTIADWSQQPLAVTHDAESIISQDPLLSLHRDLVRIESISGNEYEVGQYLTTLLHEYGFNVEMQPVAHDSTMGRDSDRPRYNIYAYRGQQRKTDVVLTSHIDTVPPYIPYSIHSSTSKHPENITILGRGSDDAKASVAAQIIAALSLLLPEDSRLAPYTFADAQPLEEHSLAMLFVVGEETTGQGMRTANELDISPKALIFGEPTENRLAAGHKGLLGMKLIATGVAAHSGYPWLGVSANSILVRALMGIEELIERSGAINPRQRGIWDEHGEAGRSDKPTLPRSKKYGVTTVNPGRIDGGAAANVIASAAHADFAIRIAAGTVQDNKDVLERTVHVATKSILKQANKDGKDASIKIEYFNVGYEPVDTDTDLDGFDDPITVNYGTDVPHWTSGGKRYLYGPGSILVAHGPNEKITARELRKAVVDYRRMVLEVLEKLGEDDAQRR